MFCDSCTAGPRQFYPLRNNNLKSTTDVTGSLLDFALSCEQGMTYFRTTNSTTDSPFPFSVGLIYRRNNDFKIVGYDLLGNGIKTNRKTGDMENWDGWHLTALKSDLTDNLNHKKQILPWGNYGDGNHSISNFTFGSNLYIAVGTSAKVQKRCSIISPNDSIQIPHPEGFITIVFNDTNHITVSGTTGNYQLREIRASDFLGV